MPSTRMLRAVAAALAILLPGLAHAQCVADAYEPDDACIASPTVLRGSDRQAHDFCDDAEDWARFEACAGREYIIETDALGSAADTVLELFDRDCLTLLASDDDGGVGNASRLSWTAPSDGVYHVRVRQADGSLGEDRVYELLLDGDTTGCSAWAFSYVAMIDSYDQALFARQLHDGGMVFAGDGGAFDAFVARTDPDGELRSTTQLSSPGEEGASDVLEAPDGGLIVAGYRDDGSGHGSDLWLVKLDPAGESVWQRAYRTAYDEPAPGANYVRMRFTPTGELALISSGNHPDTLRDMVFMLVDSGDGSLLGQRRFGGDSIDSGYGIDVLPDGGFVLAGSTQSFSTTPVPDGWIVRLDADLNVLWQSVYGGPHHDEFRSVRATADGGFVAAGGADPDGSGLYDFWLVKLDAAGTIEWQYAYPGASEDDAWSVTELRDGGYALTGLTLSFGAGFHDQEVWMLIVDDLGQIRSQTVYGGPTGNENAWSVEEMVDGGLLLAGVTQHFAGGEGDFWLMRADEHGGVGTCCSFARATSVAPWATSAARTPVVADPIGPPMSSVITSVVPIEADLPANQQCSGRPGVLPDEVSPAGSPEPLTIDKQGHCGEPDFMTRISWESGSLNGADAFFLYRGDATELDGSCHGECCAENPTQAGERCLRTNWYDDDRCPAAGESWYFLVSGMGMDGEGILGYSSAPSERAKCDTCPNLPLFDDCP